MPNHCANTLKLIPTTPEALALLNDIRARVSLEEGFFQLVDPCPEELLATPAGYPKNENESANAEKYGFANWYDFQVTRWGTKWDAYSIGVLADTGDTLTIDFDTAWSPPIGIYETLLDKGFSVEATFVEQGCDFVGYWVNGEDNTEKLSEVIPAYYNEDSESGECHELLEEYFAGHGITHSPAHFGG